MKSKSPLLSILLSIGLFAGLTMLAIEAQAKLGSQTNTKEKNATARMGYKLGDVEEINGSVTLVDLTASTVTVVSAGTPYVFRLTKTTKILVNGNKADLEALASQVNQNTTVRFVPWSEGNFAQQIEVKTS